MKKREPISKNQLDTFPNSISFNNPEEGGEERKKEERSDWQGGRRKDQ